MSRSYDLALFSGATRLSQSTNRAQGVSASTGPRGFQDLSGFLPLSDAQADQLATTPGLRAALSDGGAVLWEGRIEDQALRNGGVQLGALGDSRALEDVRYNALWSDTSVQRWRALTISDIVNCFPDRYVSDLNNRLNVGLKQGQSYTSIIAFWFGYQIPSGSSRDILAFSADVTHNLPNATWTIGLVRFSGGYLGTATTVTTIAGTGGLATTTINATWAGPCDAITINLFYNSGTPTTYAGEDGASFVRLTNLRVASTTSSPLYADEIVRSLRDHVNGVNPGALSTSNRLIVSPGIDLTGEVYEDMAPSEVLDRLAGYGDASGNRYEWGVFEGKELFFRPAGSAARQWAIDAAELEVEQTLAGLINSTYGVYEDANGRKLRTAAQTNAQSISRYGLTRQGLQEVDTTSGATATTIAATATAATATPVPRARVAVRRFSTLGGAPARGEEVRAGDTVTIRNLPPTTNTAIDRLRTFRVAQTRFDLDTGDVEIIPESPTPDLEFQLAFVLKALKR